MRSAIEQAVAAIIGRCSIVLTIDMEVAAFEKSYGRKPEIIMLNRALKGGFIREILKDKYNLGTQPEMHAVLMEPFYLDEIPAVFSLPANGEHYLILRCANPRRERVL